MRCIRELHLIVGVYCKSPHLNSVIRVSSVKDGWCWWYRKYAPGNVVLEELERRARGAGLGLWADSAPIPPWEWRKARRESLAEVNE